MDLEKPLRVVPSIINVTTSGLGASGRPNSMLKHEQAVADRHGKWAADETTGQTDRHRTPVPFTPLLLIIIAACWAVVLVAVFVERSRATANATLEEMAGTLVCTNDQRAAPAAENQKVSLLAPREAAAAERSAAIAAPASPSPQHHH
jgi:hypothetical protein